MNDEQKFGLVVLLGLMAAVFLFGAIALMPVVLAVKFAIIGVLAAILAVGIAMAP